MSFRYLRRNQEDRTSNANERQSWRRPYTVGSQQVSIENRRREIRHRVETKSPNSDTEK